MAELEIRLNKWPDKCPSTFTFGWPFLNISQQPYNSLYLTDLNWNIDMSHKLNFGKLLIQV